MTITADSNKLFYPVQRLIISGESVVMLIAVTFKYLKQAVINA